MKTGVSTVPCAVVSRPARALEEASLFSNLNIGQVDKRKDKAESRNNAQRTVN
jgi:hypothetical protein